MSIPVAKMNADMLKNLLDGGANPADKPKKVKKSKTGLPKAPSIGGFSFGEKPKEEKEKMAVAIVPSVDEDGAVVSPFEASKRKADFPETTSTYKKPRIPGGMPVGGEKKEPAVVTSAADLWGPICADNVEKLRRLLPTVQTPNDYIGHGHTALTKACYKGSAALVKVLLDDQRVDPTKKEQLGRTPIEWAQHYGFHNIVKMLERAIEVRSLPPVPKAQS
eukprot:NODE_5550_length_934_cov_71.628853_g5327_i0.p1 GENE.NODE_5550_length_934_cov_71.628853_g5327_i0~~NODE_5550_length_934_cov_71.628853_g5327_i0.p1  ORF type:complete len:220 (+),score=67.66 NODE_5550_length_934_cov_71.628853_g5327_i0:78-737(+)